MKKNITIYKHGGDFQRQEGFTLPSSKKDLVERLHYFSNKIIHHAEIDNIVHQIGSQKGLLSTRHLALYIYVTRRIEAKEFEAGYKEEEVNSDTAYTINIARGWKLYENDILVYDNSDLLKYPPPNQYQKLFSGTKLLHADIDDAWSQATFVFDNNLKIEVLAGMHANSTFFFSINKQAEPFRLHLNFAKPEAIKIVNESVQLKVSQRKKRPNFII